MLVSDTTVVSDVTVVSDTAEVSEIEVVSADTEVTDVVSGAEVDTVTAAVVAGVVVLFCPFPQADKVLISAISTRALSFLFIVSPLKIYIDI